MYDKNDVEHVGWYYIPVEAEKAIWMEPYYNKNLDIYMISYVIPINENSQLIGVVGMDIDFNYIVKKIDNISIYDTGHAFVTDDKFVILHGEHYPQGTHVSSLSKELAEVIESELMSSKTLYSYSHKGKSQKVVFSILSNGMYLAVTAPVSEIYQNADKFVVQVIIITLCSILIFLVITILMTKTIVKPLKALNEAAKEIANGNLDISFECKSQDEVGMLTKSLKETAKQLKIRIDYINNLAFLDKLTGVKNNTAYLREIAIVKEEINKNQCVFAVFLVDINGLKRINDTYGHDYGNELIILVSKVVKECFACEEIYRIGGDEFVVLMKEIEKKKCDELKNKFNSMLKEEKGKIRASAAIGAAVYEKDIDESYENVFRRADMDMYKNKEQMKKHGEDSKINLEYQN